MPDAVDLPNQDEAITRMTSDMRTDLAALALSDLFTFGRGVLKYKDMTKRTHGPLCVFLQYNPALMKLVLYPRDHYKTSAGTISGNMQKATADPEQRILIRNESATNAQRMLRAIRQHAEGNRIYRALYSHVIPKDTRRVRWNDEEIDFKREGQYPEPTFDSIGMTGAVTSRHYTHICDDDPISEEAVKSEKVMADAITRIGTVLELLTKPEQDTYWLIGTRWALHDVYSWSMQNYGNRMAKLIRGAIEDGQPIFPELLSLETLALKRQTLGEYKFSCLMMNNPRNTELQDLNIDDLKWWRWRGGSEDMVELLGKNGEVEESWPLSRLDITTTVDLAPAEKISSDRNAVVTCGITPTARAVVLEAWGKRCTPLELIQKLFEIKRRFAPRVFGIEGVAYQKAFKYFLRQEADREGLYLHIEELKAVGKKEIRVRGLQPVMAVGRLYASPVSHILRNEISDFPLGEHDDVLDALSMQLQLWRGQMSPERWEKLKKEEAKLMRQVMDKERYLTDSPIAGVNFDYDDLTSDDLPGPVLEKYLTRSA